MNRLESVLKYSAKQVERRTGRKVSGFVYLIQCRDFVKVGFASNVALRLTMLQTGCPYDLKLLKAFPVINMKHDEARLHQFWQRYEVRGEWFQVPFGELVSAINADTFDGIFLP